MKLFDTVRIKSSGDVGFISCIVGDGQYAVNTGDEDNQPVIPKEDLEVING